MVAALKITRTKKPAISTAAIWALMLMFRYQNHSRPGHDRARAHTPCGGGGVALFSTAPPAAEVLDRMVRGGGLLLVGASTAEAALCRVRPVHPTKSYTADPHGPWLPSRPPSQPRTNH